MKLPVVPLTSSSLVSPKRRQSGRQSETQSEARRKYVIAGSVGRTAMLATAFWLLFQPAVPSAQQSGTSTTTSGTAGYQADQDSHAASTRPESGAVIEKNVLIAAGATIIGGITVGENSVVAAGSVVTRDVPPNTLVEGNPARVIRSIAG